MFAYTAFYLFALNLTGHLFPYLLLEASHAQKLWNPLGLLISGVKRLESDCWARGPHCNFRQKRHFTMMCVPCQGWIQQVICPSPKRVKKGGNRVRTVEFIKGIPPLISLVIWVNTGIIHLNQIPFAKQNAHHLWWRQIQKESTVGTLTGMVYL